ncbi:unnamed protein product [Bursaphelenchus okinawaensis]|uniref:peptidylglycine monooxygenase n=1 Tax=Bursaphelenchus okinawaensis TaxID=465554 RepID=A0A811KG10_9BILA|nr:unnamed protein product [Bursaphelenchus okinawaensis]CAG9102147.1 unnamed protein product [Bursaphelenchus okinawaensis]
MLFLCFFIILWVGNEAKVFRYTIQAPGFSSTEDDEYISMTVKPPPGYIIGYEPNATSEHIHHLMLAGCSEPYHKSLGLNHSGDTCDGRDWYMYSWAKNAGDISLPKNVSYKIGHQKDSVQYLVLIYHYANKAVDGYKDYSGLTLVMSDEPTKYSAVEYLFVAGTPLPPGEKLYKANVSCTYKSKTKATPFFYRVHTHDHGLVVSSYIFNYETGFHLVGKRHPLWPQSFEKVENPVAVQENDILAAQCIYNTENETDDIPMGMTNHHEMCNYQIMFYYDSNEENPFEDSSMCYDSALEEQQFEYPNVDLLPHNQTLLDMAKHSEHNKHKGVKAHSEHGHAVAYHG